MGCYHFHMTQVKRSAGQSAVACAAYRAGEKLYSTYYGETNDYTRKGGVVRSEIFLPEYAPKEYADRETLWNAVEWAESNRRAQLAHSFDISLMNEFSMKENIELARAFVREELVSRGMIVDMAIHDPARKDGADPNPHIHIMVPVRPLKEDGTWGIKQKKIQVLDQEGNPVLDKNGKQAYRAVSTTDWSNKETLEALRRSWADRCNQLYKEKGLLERVDDRSYADREIDQIPTIHEGPAVRAMEAKGIQTALGNLNRLIRQFNELTVEAKRLLEWFRNRVDLLKKQLDQAQQPTLIGYLQQYYDERDRVAQTFAYGTKKAKLTNLKEFSSAIVFLRTENLNSPEQLGQRITELNSELDAVRQEIRGNTQTIHEMTDFLKAWEDYHRLKPIQDELYHKHFGREKFKKEHDKELKLFYRSKRILTEHLDEDGKIPVNTWRRMLKEANDNKDILQEKKDLLYEKLKPLQKVQRSVDYVLNEMQTDSGSGRRNTDERIPVQDAEKEKSSIKERLAEKEKRIEQEKAAKKEKKKYRGSEL